MLKQARWLHEMIQADSHLSPQHLDWSPALCTMVTAAATSQQASWTLRKNNWQLDMYLDLGSTNEAVFNQYILARTPHPLFGA